MLRSSEISHNDGPLFRQYPIPYVTILNDYAVYHVESQSSRPQALAILPFYSMRLAEFASLISHSKYTIIRNQ